MSYAMSESVADARVLCSDRTARLARLSHHTIEFILGTCNQTHSEHAKFAVATCEYAAAAHTRVDARRVVQV